MQICLKKISLIASLCAFSLSSTAVFAQDYYKWVDSKGSTHYTKTPPPKNAKKKTKVDTYGWHNSAPTASRTQNTSAPSEVSNTTNSADKTAQQAANPAPVAASHSSEKVAPQ